MNFERLVQRTAATLLMSMICLISLAQSRTVSGVVLDSRGDPVIGANIRVVSDASIGTITDLDGKFSLAVPGTAKQLEISFIGMQTQTVSIVAGQPVHVTLAEDAEILDEVVVIGYQTVKRKDLTGSVASVSGEQIAAMPVANAAQALQGKLAGVNVTTQDGRPDAAVSIRVRGGGSISQSNDPLVLIDGVSGSLSDIPGDQIESIDVLKDASSTAIYGARGANGVILVTTKGAKEGRVVVSYNGYAKFNTPTKYMDALNPYDYLAYSWASAASVGGNSYMEPLEKLYGIGRYTTTNSGGIESYRNVKTDNIQKKIYGDSFSHNHDLSVTGGTEKTKVLFGVNYMDEDGMKLASYYRRANVSLKVNQKIAKNLDLSLDTRYTNIKKMGDEGVTNGSGSILSSSYRFRPIATEDILGDLSAMNEGMIENYAKQSQWDRYNPVNRINDKYAPNAQQSLRGILSLNWGIVKGLTYHTDLSLSQTWNQNKEWTGAIINNYLDDNTGEVLYAGNANLEKKNSWGLRWTNTLSYDFTLGKIHRLNILAGHEVSDSGGDGLKASGTYFPANFTKENAFAMINQYDSTKGVGDFSSSVSTPSRILSFFGRLNYNLMERYLLTVTFRADGSSKFAPSNRWGYFPSLSAGWRLSEEGFMEGASDWMQSLKVRASWGQLGNQEALDDYYPWLITYAIGSSSGGNYPFDGNVNTGIMQKAQKLSTISWEKSSNWGIGFDLSVLSCLDFTVDYYNRKTTGIIMDVPVPGSFGLDPYKDNVGAMRNSGFEVTAAFRKQWNDWKFSATGNMAVNKNEILNLGGVNEMLDKNNNYFINRVGSAYKSFYGYVADGLFRSQEEADAYTEKYGNPFGNAFKAGDIKYKDVNGDGKLTSADRDVSGSEQPNVTFGLNLSASWKNFDLSVFMQGACGVSRYFNNEVFGEFTGDSSHPSTAWFDAWSPENPNGTFPRVAESDRTSSRPSNYSTFWIFKTNYLRVKNIQFGYNLPDNWLKGIGVSRAKIYYSGENLFKFDNLPVNIDPEAPSGRGSHYPQVCTNSIGINITF